VIIHACPWKPFDVKHRLLQRVALQNKTNINVLFVLYGYYSDCSIRKFKDHVPLGPRQVLPRQVSLIMSQGRRTCLHPRKIQGRRSRLGSIESSTLSVWHHGTKIGMRGSYSWYVAARFRTGCHEADPTVLCAHGVVFQTQPSSSAFDDQSWKCSLLVIYNFWKKISYTATWELDEIEKTIGKHKARKKEEQKVKRKLTGSYSVSYSVMAAPRDCR
jgi:hypothetical protein